ncbi:type II toxin-antitoxin system antitoxin SocA domain-containing protein [Rhizorhabdus phycosphaerae]|uniref:Panacea domain-containing protein n=1 Tax=Rhizorhabdus phycosphaerae TaxID=2711156 RepID=UPI0013EB2C6C
MYDARAVANFLLDCADNCHKPLTNMELLKHIYYAHGWHLASEDKPLISNRIEAWEHGPVIRAVYDAFKVFGSSPITSRARIVDWATGEERIAEGIFSRETASLLQATLTYYAGYGAFELSALTHEPGGPWHRVWHRADGRVRMNMEITNELIKAHFLASSKTANVQ